MQILLVLAGMALLLVVSVVVMTTMHLADQAGLPEDMAEMFRNM